MKFSELYKKNSAWETDTMLRLRTRDGLVIDRAEKLFKSYGFKDVDSFLDENVWLEEFYS